VNTFAKAYTQKSNITIPRQLKKEIRHEVNVRKETDSNDVMKNDITMVELNKYIKQLNRTSTGPDHVTNEMQQHIGNITRQKLLDRYNLSWRSQVPQCWKEATTFPFLKK
jgi:hypothetical protein